MAFLEELDQSSMQSETCNVPLGNWQLAVSTYVDLCIQQLTSLENTP